MPILNVLRSHAQLHILANLVSTSCTLSIVYLGSGTSPSQMGGSKALVPESLDEIRLQALVGTNTPPPARLHRVLKIDPAGVNPPITIPTVIIIPLSIVNRHLLSMQRLICTASEAMNTLARLSLHLCLSAPNRRIPLRVLSLPLPLELLPPQR
jgi:hypothetical protein